MSNADTCESIPNVKTCLTSHQHVGLAFIAEAGFLSLAAIALLLCLIVRNMYYRVKVRGSLAGDVTLPWSPFDIYILALILFDTFQAIGTVLDVHWVRQGFTQLGGLCTAQGAIQQFGETGVALITMAIAIHTFILIWWRIGAKRVGVALIVTAGVTLFVLLYVVIALVVNRKKDEDFYAPSPYWCWIRDGFLTDKVLGEYLWLWLTLLVSVVTYIPLFLLSKGIIGVHDEKWWKVTFRWRKSERIPEDERPRSRNNMDMLAYPVAYCFCVLPVSAARWSAFVSGDDSVPSGATFFAIFAHDLFGAVNVLLLLVTRPGLLILQDPRRNNAEGALPNNASFDGTGSSSELGQAHPDEK